MRFAILPDIILLGNNTCAQLKDCWININRVMLLLLLLLHSPEDLQQKCRKRHVQELVPHRILSFGCWFLTNIPYLLPSQVCAAHPQAVMSTSTVIDFPSGLS